MHPVGMPETEEEWCYQDGGEILNEFPITDWTQDLFIDFPTYAYVPKSQGEVLAVPHADGGSSHSPKSFGQATAFHYADGSSNQAISPSLDETVPSQKSAEALPGERYMCEWPACTTSFMRKGDLRRHVNHKHLPVLSFRCEAEGCNKTFRRRDKLREHERRSHDSEAHIPQKDLSATITRTLDNVGSVGLGIEYHVPDVTDSSHSFWMQVDEQARQGLNNDTQRSTPATEDSCGPSENFSTASDGFSRKDSISTRSTSSHRTISSKNRRELRSSRQLEEIDHAKRRFACPYRKNNPHKYNIHNHLTCATSGYDSITRLK